MTSKDIEKLEQADRLMFDLAKSTTPKDDILKVGQLLKEAGVLQDPTDDLKTIVAAYNQDAQNEIKKALRRKMRTTVTLNLAALTPYLNNSDPDITAIITDTLDNFKQYGQIVLRFNEKKATWQTEKSTADYQQLFSNLDSRRTNIHNACIDNINIFNRLIANGAPFATWDNPNITEIKEIPRSDIGNAILKFYVKKLINNGQHVLKQMSE
ncbi:MAG: DUF3232 domain-containing protein [Lactobacillus sp.]|nr:DUF3232 domain-containing protein [Lactobacillus sp.]